jgi:hypothetical protein
MITLAALRQKAERAWFRSLRARLASKFFFPWVVPFRKFSRRRDNFAGVQERTAELVVHSKAQRGYGYTLVLETRNTRSWGRNQLPQSIIFDTADDLDAFLKRASQSSAFDRDAAILLERFHSFVNGRSGTLNRLSRMLATGLTSSRFLFGLSKTPALSYSSGNSQSRCIRNLSKSIGAFYISCLVSCFHLTSSRANILRSVLDCESQNLKCAFVSSTTLCVNGSAFHSSV